MVTWPVLSHLINDDFEFNNLFNQHYVVRIKHVLGIKRLTVQFLGEQVLIFSKYLCVSCDGQHHRIVVAVIS